MVGLGDFGMRLYFWRAIAMLPPEERAGAASQMMWQHLLFSLWPIIPLNVLISLTASGPFAQLLHLYTLSCLFSQATFDWWFFSQERYVSLFLFNAVSGLLLVGLCLLLVHGPADLWIYALGFSLSFALPGLALSVFGKPWPATGTLSEIFRIPKRTLKFLGYDWSQRAYTAFAPILAGIFFAKAAIGQLRLALLFYALVFTIAAYLGSAVFNQIARTESRARQQSALMEITVWLFLLVVPYSAVAKAAAAFAVSAYMSPVYAPAVDCLNILIPFLFLPAAANFLREALVGAGRPLLSLSSYLATIAATASVGVFLQAGGIAGFCWSLLIGELTGFLIVLWALKGASLEFKMLARVGLALLGYFATDRFIAYAAHGGALSHLASIGVIAVAALIAALPIATARIGGPAAKSAA